jgi:hypothetical protein
MKKLFIATSIITTIMSSTVLADSEKRIVENITLTEEQSLDIKFPVGSVEIEVVDSNQLEIEIELKHKSQGWNDWFNSDKDLTNIELKKEMHHGKIALEIDDDDLNQKWFIKVPRTAAIDIDLGVGSVDIDELDNSVEIDVGVGSVMIETNTEDFKQIDLESGVGDTRISGFSGNSNQKRTMVSSSSDYSSSGQYRIDIEVGVGDIKVRN